MKYITTDKHPVFKEGKKLDVDLINELSHMLGIPAFNTCIEKGYIKELEEKEFTKSDVIGISSKAFREYFNQSGVNFIISSEVLNISEITARIINEK